MAKFYLQSGKVSFIVNAQDAEGAALWAMHRTIEKMVEQLAGKHWMFQGDAANRLKMCEDCRVVSQFGENSDPFKFGERPKPRTTEDYLREREDPPSDD